MPYAVRNRLNYIGTRQNEVRGEPIVYSRGTNSVTLYQCPGHTDVQDLVPENAITIGRYVDFIIFASQLVIPSVGLTLPVHNDLIQWEGKTYTVVSPTATDDVYNFTTMYRDRLRIHTILTTDP